MGCTDSKLGEKRASVSDLCRAQLRQLVSREKKLDHVSVHPTPELLPSCGPTAWCVSTVGHRREIKCKLVFFM